MIQYTDMLKIGLVRSDIADLSDGMGVMSTAFQNLRGCGNAGWSRSFHDGQLVGLVAYFGKFGQLNLIEVAEMLSDQVQSHGCHCTSPTYSSNSSEDTGQVLWFSEF